MSYRDTVLQAAYDELADPPTNWHDYPERILDYFYVSTAHPTTRDAALKISWCSYFVHWCLVQGGMSILPRVGSPADLGKMTSIGRFIKAYGGVYDAYNVGAKNYVPQPGDMFYKPSPNNHIGLISDVRSAGNGNVQIRSINGNSGHPYGSSYYFGNKIGKGYVFQPAGWTALDSSCWYIQLE